MDEDLADLAEAIHGIARELRLGIDADPDHLTLAESHVMRYIDHRPGVTPSDVAAFTGLRRSNLSAVLRTLTARGLVERRVDPDDARAVNLYPTRRATGDLNRLRQQWAAQLSGSLGGDTRHLGDALGLLRRLESGLIAERLGGNGIPGTDFGDS